MKKLILAVPFLLTPLSAHAQLEPTKFSSFVIGLPTQSSLPPNAFVPVVVNGIPYQFNMGALPGVSAVTSITANAPLTGGTITSIGSIGLNFDSTLRNNSGSLGIANSAALPGSPTTTTPSPGDNSTKIPTTAYVQTAMGGIGGTTLPAVSNNTGLTAVSTVSVSRIVRTGFGSNGDVPTPLLYTPLSTTCTTNSAFTGAISGTTLTVSALTVGNLYVGAPVTGSGVTAATVITAYGTGHGGNGTYTVNNSQSISAEAMVGTGDGGSQVASSDGKCWITTTTDPRQFGAVAAISGGFAVTTTASSTTIGVAGGSFTSSNIGNYFVAVGVGPNRGWYEGQITAVGSTTSITATPAPTQSAATSLLVYYGPGNLTAFQAAFDAAKSFQLTSVIPGGTYLVDGALQYNVVNYNSQRIPPPLLQGSPGSTLMQVASTSAAIPLTNSFLTIGGYANGSDFSQYIRNGEFNANGLTIDCAYNPNSIGLNLPFSQEVRIYGLQIKNCTQAKYYLGDTGAPATSGSIFLFGDKTDHDIFYVPITTRTSANPPVYTTAIQHGFATGQVVSIIGDAGIPSPGPQMFWITVLSPTTFALRNVNGTTWPTFTSATGVALTNASNYVIHVVNGVTSANPAQITLATGEKLTNGNSVCLEGIAGTSSSTSNNLAPDGCYTISNVSAPGADGSTQFTVPVNTTNFTYVSSGIARLESSAVADIGVFENNISDVEMFGNSLNGDTYPIYASSTSGYNGYYFGNHVSNSLEAGWIVSGHVLGGGNTLADQCDGPVINCYEFLGPSNTVNGGGLNMSAFQFLLDDATWLSRLDGPNCPGPFGTSVSPNASMALTGAYINGVSGSIRVNELSNCATVGNPSFFGPVANYQKLSLGLQSNVLFTMPAVVLPGLFVDSSTGNAGITSVSTHSGSQGIITSYDTNTSSVGLNIASSLGGSTAYLNATNNAGVFSASIIGGNSSGNPNTPNVPTSAGGGGLFVCIDTSGNLYKKATCP